MVLNPIPHSLHVHFFGSRPQPPTSHLLYEIMIYRHMRICICWLKNSVKIERLCVCELTNDYRTPMLKYLTNTYTHFDVVNYRIPILKWLSNTYVEIYDESHQIQLSLMGLVYFDVVSYCEVQIWNQLSHSFQISYVQQSAYTPFTMTKHTRLTRLSP